MDKLPSVQIIVLNWNGRSLLDTCLPALSNLRYPQYDILLVDNDSTDDSVDFTRRNFPQVNILQTGKNLGYAGGNNLALIDLRTDYAVLVNPDIIVTPDWLMQLIQPMHADNSIGIAGCKLHYPGGQTIQHAGGTITHPQALPAHQGMHDIDTGQFETLRDVEYVTGASLAIGRETLERIGLLDEGFFMYFEEADWCARARKAGYRVVYIPQSVAVHDESATAVKGSSSYLLRFHSGRWRFLLKHFAIEEILSTTLSAEEQWLAGRKRNERHALRRVYRAIITNLDEILAARAAGGAAEVDDAHKMRLVRGLFRLRQVLIDQSIDQDQMNRLVQKGQITEKPLHSQAPVVGPFLARFRTRWARIAVSVQAESFITQQNEINLIMANQLREIENQFQIAEIDLLHHDEKQYEINQKQLKIRAKMSHAFKLLESIVERLERIEERSP